MFENDTDHTYLGFCYYDTHAQSRTQPVLHQDCILINTQARMNAYFRN